MDPARAKDEDREGNVLDSIRRFELPGCDGNWKKKCVKGVRSEGVVGEGFMSVYW